MTIREKTIDLSRSRPDKVNVIVLAGFLILAIVLGVVAFRLSRNFFASTSVINVGEAPPVIIDDNGQVTQANATQSAQGSKNQAPIVLPPGEKTNLSATGWQGTNRVTLLVMGLDYRDWQTGVDIPRTDTMILFSIDPLNMTAGMISIPRDMWVNIPGFGYSRINTAYRVGEMYKLPEGGSGLAAKTVEQFLGVPVDYVALIDFNAFVRFIDELGGLDMKIRQKITVDPIGPGNTRVIEPGTQTLDGASVLAYARNRYTNDGDFDRSKRQQEVIMAMYKQITQFNQLPMLISKAPKLYTELSSGIHTNLTLDQVIQLAVLASKIDEKNIRKGVFDPHRDVQYASVITGDGPADVLVPNPDQIRILRDEVFVNGSQFGPSTAVNDPLERLKTENARVVLKNGNSNPALFQQAVDLLNSLNVNIIGQETAGQVTSVTTFVDHTGKPYTINLLTEKLNVPQSRVKIDINPGASADLEITIGEDWKGSGQ